MRSINYNFTENIQDKPLKLINVWLIHSIKTPKLQHLIHVSFLFILGCLNEICMNFIHLFYSVIIRDKVLCRKLWWDWWQNTLKNLSDFHTKIAFSHNNAHWTQSIRPAVSLFVIQLSTHLLETLLADWKVENMVINTGAFFSWCKKVGQVAFVLRSAEIGNVARELWSHRSYM